MKLVMKTVVIVQWLHLSLAYSGGVPDLACSSMFPSGHLAEAQNSTPPYRIITHRTTYRPGETINVDILGEKTFFTGVYLQARHVGCHKNGSQALGAFTATDSRLQTRHCFGVVHSAVSHSSSAMKDSVAVFWTAPVVSSGHLVFRATVVKDRTTFWVGVESPPVIDLQSSDTLTCDKLTEESKLLSKKSQTNSTKSLSDKHLLKGDNGSVLLKRSEINKGNSSTRSVVLSIMRTISLLSVITLSHFFFFLITVF